MPTNARATTRLVVSLSAFGTFALAISAGCTKTNDIDAGDGDGAGSCNGEACEGACVEDVCRGYCDQNYQCPGEDETCTDIEGAAVCLPPGAGVHESYAPFDMLAECASSGCEIPLDAPPFEGVLRECPTSGSFTLADMANPDFDYEAACAGLAGYDYDFQLVVEGRRIYELYEGNCTWSHAGGGPTDALIRYSCDNVLDYETNQTEFTVSADFWRVVEREGAIYVWRNFADPFGSIRESRPFLYMMTDESTVPPESCEFGENFASTAPPEDCDLPVYPRTGAAIGAQFEGLWIACDSTDVLACEEGWAAPGLNDSRMAMYVDARGFGQFWSSELSAAEVRPTECNAAFRTEVIVGRSQPIGPVSVTAHRFVEVLDGPAGRYVVRSDPFGGRYFKQVPLPADFVDPCAGTQPNLTW